MATKFGLIRDVGWEIGVSRVFAADAQAVWDLIVSDAGTALWVGEGVQLPRQAGATFTAPSGTSVEVRSFLPLDRIRLTWRPCGWDHPTTLQVAITPAPTGTTVHFQQECLNGPQESEVQRAHWKWVLDLMSQQLVAVGAPPG